MQFPEERKFWEHGNKSCRNERVSLQYFVTWFGFGCKCFLSLASATASQGVNVPPWSCTCSKINRKPPNALSPPPPPPEMVRDGGKMGRRMYPITCLSGTQSPLHPRRRNPGPGRWKLVRGLNQFIMRSSNRLQFDFSFVALQLSD